MIDWLQRTGIAATLLVMPRIPIKMEARALSDKEQDTMAVTIKKIRERAQREWMQYCEAMLDPTPRPDFPSKHDDVPVCAGEFDHTDIL